MTHFGTMSRNYALVQQENLAQIEFSEVARYLTMPNLRHTRWSHVVSLEF